MPTLEFSPLAQLLCQVAAILLASRLLAVLARWLGQPLVVAELLAGVALGPSLLGRVWPEGMAALFPDASLSILRIMSQFGLVLFMFLVGVEFNPALLKQRASTFVVVSHTSIIVPFLLGAATGWWLWPYGSGPVQRPIAFVLFMGTAMSVTAFPVLARILTERGLQSSPVGMLAIACAAVDDVTAWCLLTFVTAVARAYGFVDGVWTTALALLFIFGMVRWIRPLLQRMGQRLPGNPQSLPRALTGTLLLLLVVSAFTEVIGIHALFGAFALGAVFPKQRELTSFLLERLETVAVVVLLPLFFAYTGLRTRIGLGEPAREWLLSGTLILIASLGKFGGSAVAARLTGRSWRDAGAVGVLMNTRGLMELIVLNVGLDLGVLSPAIFANLVVMALVTTFATTPILRLLYPEPNRALPWAVARPRDATVELGLDG